MLEPSLVIGRSALPLADVVFASGDDQDQRIADAVGVAVLQLLIRVARVRRAEGAAGVLIGDHRAARPRPHFLLRLAGRAAAAAAGAAAWAALHRAGRVHAGAIAPAAVGQPVAA